MKKLEYTGLDGHLILLCKNHYKIKSGMIESLKMIWAIRCGYEYNRNDNTSLPYIANALYRILEPTIDNNYAFMSKLHKYMTTFLYGKDNGTGSKLINFYCSEIAILTVKEKVGLKYKIIMKLPKPKKQVFNRILNGNGRYDDYKLILAK